MMTPGARTALLAWWLLWFLSASSHGIEGPFLTPLRVRSNIRIMKTLITTLRCRRCKHAWVPRKAVVYLCPECKSPRWDEPENAKSPLSMRGK